MYAPNFASLTTPLPAPPFLSFYHSFHCHLTNFYRSEDSTFFIFLLTQRFLAHVFHGLWCSHRLFIMHKKYLAHMSKSS